MIYPSQTQEIYDLLGAFRINPDIYRRLCGLISNLEIEKNAYKYGAIQKAEELAKMTAERDELREDCQLAERKASDASKRLAILEHETFDPYDKDD